MKKSFELGCKDKKLAILIDPDFAKNKEWLRSALFNLNMSQFDLILLGGSLVEEPHKIDQLILEIKAICELPVYLFPGHSNQVSAEADGILFTSLLSGRNPEFLIGQQMLAAPQVKKWGLNSLPTAYLLIGGSNTSAHYMSQTSPIPADKVDIALATALAGELMGMKAVYMDGGSGAEKSPSKRICKTLSAKLGIPIIIGGGIRDAAQMDELYMAGANMLVVGTAIEEDPEFILTLSDQKKEMIK